MSKKPLINFTKSYNNHSYRQKEEEEKRKREELAAARAAINTVVAEDAKAVQRTLYPTVKNLENLHIEEAQSSKEK